MFFFSLVKPRKEYEKYPGDDREPAGIFMVQFPDKQVHDYLATLPVGSFNNWRHMSFDLIYFYEESDVYGFRMALESYIFRK